MYTGLEIPYFLALFYPALNWVWWFPKIRPDVEKEIQHESDETDGVEVYDYRSEYIPPTYINVNNISVPVGGYTTKEARLLVAKLISKEKQNEYFNYSQIESKVDLSMSFMKRSHINTHDALIKTFNYYKIPTDRFAINLPLKINYFHYKNGFYYHKFGLVASNKENLVQSVLWRKRLPYTFIIGSTAALGLSACWFHYWVSHRGYLPPFHPERLKSYYKMLQQKLK
jgi:hypothetical protein